MIDPTVSDFFIKDNPGYLAEYDHSHGPRLDALVARYGLDKLRGQRILDVGGGLGFLGKRLDRSNDYWVIDGAEITPEQRLCRGNWLKADLDHDTFSRHDIPGFGPTGLRDVMIYTDRHLGSFDAAFCLETLEHIGNPHHALVEIKKLVKPDGDIYISIPTETVWHNAPMPTLLWPENPNFRLFLQQMALPILDFYHYTPATVGWPAYTYRCRNAAWTENPRRLLFPKDEAKFLGATPLQATNL